MNRNVSRNRVIKIQSDFVKNLKTGRFDGEFTLKWIGPELFLYEPNPSNPFRFIRQLENGDSEIIQPETMETDGGSIPLIAQIATLRTTWEYGPAYIIHDWEFFRHDIDESFKKSFEEVNLTLAEAIWTLMHEGYPTGATRAKPVLNEKNVYTIYSGVMSPIAKSIWDEKSE